MPGVALRFQGLGFLLAAPSADVSWLLCFQQSSLAISSAFFAKKKSPKYRTTVVNLLSLVGGGSPLAGPSIFLRPRPSDDLKARGGVKRSVGLTSSVGGVFGTVI